MQPQARDAFAALLAQGWVDTARQLHPRERMYTYWTDERAFAQGKGMRLDFILLSKPLRPHLRDVAVDAAYRSRVKPSDHAPMWVHLAYPCAA